MTSSPHDALFKRAFRDPRDAAALFQLALPPTVASPIRWAEMRSQPGSFVSPELAERHTDLLFSAPCGDDEVLLYLLLEHQSSVDPWMALRMLGYVLAIWERHVRETQATSLPIILPLVVSHTPAGWTAARSIWDLVSPHPSAISGAEAFVPRFGFALEDLTLRSNDDLKASALSIFARLSAWVLRVGRMGGTVVEQLPVWAAEIEGLARTNDGIDCLRALFRYIYLVADEVQFGQFRANLNTLAPRAEDVVMTIAEQLLQQGRAEGRAEGELKGRAEGELKGRAAGLRGVLLAQLRHKFGDDVDERVVRSIEDADDAALERYSLRVLSADSISAVLGE